MQGVREFFGELQKRHVIRAAFAHVLVFWLLIQVADVVFPYIGIASNPVRWALLIGVATFPITLAVAWFFEHPWQRYTRSRIAIDAIIITVIGVTAVSWVLRNIPQVVQARTSIVILPFEHSGDPLEQSLSRAMAFEINSLLMRSRAIDVIGFETAMSTLLEGLDGAAIAERLNVEHVLTGKISVSGDEMRVDAAILDRTGSAIWIRALGASLDELFFIQESIAAAVAGKLSQETDVVPIAALAADRCPMPADPAALEKYYTARYYVELRTDSDTSKQQLADAITLYEALIAAYPDFAEAHSGLAWALAHQPVYDPQNAAPDWQYRMIQLAEQALQLCPTLTEAKHLLPNEYDHENRWLNDYQQLTAFIEQEPQRAENHQRLARHFRESGLTDRAIEVAERNFAMNPLSPKAAKILSAAYQYAERFDEAVELADLAAELGSTSPAFARTAEALAACDSDVDCIIDAMPPQFESLREPFRMIYPVPADADGERAAIDLALQLTEQSGGMLLNWFNGSSCGTEHLTPLFFELWDANKTAGQYWHWPNAWQKRCGNVWSHERFPAFVEEVGLVEYWQVAGWPAACRPDGDSVVCGEAAAELGGTP